MEAGYEQNPYPEPNTRSHINFIIPLTSIGRCRVTWYSYNIPFTSIGLDRVTWYVSPYQPGLALLVELRAVLHSLARTFLHLSLEFSI